MLNHTIFKYIHSKPRFYSEIIIKSTLNIIPLHMLNHSTRDSYPNMHKYNSFLIKIVI